MDARERQGPSEVDEARGRSLLGVVVVFGGGMLRGGEMGLDAFLFFGRNGAQRKRKNDGFEIVEWVLCKGG